MDTNDDADELARQQIAALLAIGKDPAYVSRVSGVAADELPGIAQDEKKRAVMHATAGKRGLDARGVVTAAAAYQKAASSDPWAPVPADVAAIVKRRVEIDPGLAGLDRRILVALATQRKDTVIGGLFQVGVEDAWTSINVLAGRYVVPAGAGWTEGWNMEVAWSHVECYVDMVVEAMSQSINPSSLLLLHGTMDWGLWQLRAEYVVRHDEVIGRFDSYRSRATVVSPPRDATSSTSRALDHEAASRLVSDAVPGDRDEALAFHRSNSWAPFVTFDPAWRHEWLDRLVLVLYDPPAQGQRRLDAFANMFPVATLYTGECRAWYGGGKTRTRRAAVVDALVPKGSVTVMADHVGAVASNLTPHVLLMPECHAPTIPYPAGYPAGDITRIYRPGGTRASALQDKHIASFSEHWAAQQAIDK